MKFELDGWEITFAYVSRDLMVPVATHVGCKDTRGRKAGNCICEPCMTATNKTCCGCETPVPKEVITFARLIA